MMGDLKKRASFARVVNYVNNPKKARLIDSKDVRLDDNATIARSMHGQADDKPGRKLKNPVYHISLDFAHEDAPKLYSLLSQFCMWNDANLMPFMHNHNAITH